MKVAAFNVRNLGITKVRNSFVSQHLIEIMSQYSIVVILEVMDQNMEAMDILHDKLNEASEHSYEMTRSDSLGRDRYKEQYVYFYREGEVELEDDYQYEDDQAEDEDAFEREPYIVHFVGNLVLIPIHTKPEDAAKELDELYDVFTAVREKWGTTKIMILGDFNADGRYLSEEERDELRICNEPFHWLIDDDVNTTVSNSTDETYDRIVVYGKRMLDAIVPGSATAFNFQEEFDLTEREALRISDHYPVEVELKIKPNPKKGPQKNRGAKRKPGQMSAATTSKKRRQQTTGSYKLLHKVYFLGKKNTF